MVEHDQEVHLETLEDPSTMFSPNLTDVNENYLLKKDFKSNFHMLQSYNDSRLQEIDSKSELTNKPQQIDLTREQVCFMNL